MRSRQTSASLPHLCQSVLQQYEAGLTDRELLEDYLGRRDEAALGVLVRRHGPMVWGVCRRLLGNHHDAEDAFQATFLVFVRKAASIAAREQLANWLHGVARQTARKARATSARRQARERQVPELPEPTEMPPEDWHDWHPILDEEVNRLPSNYRSVLVLCDLEGRSRKEVAQQLGCPEGTVAGWLARARALLAKRLARRGVGPADGALALAPGVVPVPVVSATITAAHLFAAGSTTTISTQVAALTLGVLNAMFLSKLKSVATFVLLVLTVAGLGAVLFQPTRAEEPPPAAQQRAKPPAAPVVNDDDIPTEFELDKLVGPPVLSRLKVRFAGGTVLSVKDGKLPLELVFTNFADEPQELLYAEFSFALLDRNGEQVQGGLVRHEGIKKKIILKGRTTTVRPLISLDPVVKADEEYYLFCGVRHNQTGLVKFTTKK